MNSLVDWMTNSQLLVPDIVGYFSHNCKLTDPAIGEILKTDVLPHLQSRFMVTTSMEKELGNLIYLSQADEDGDLSADLPP